MEGTEEPRMDKYKEVTKDWNIDTSCMCASLPVSISGNINCLTSVTECVHVNSKPSEPNFTYQTLTPPPPQKKQPVLIKKPPQGVFRGD